MSNNIGEQVCEAIGIISESLINSLQFDSTIKCTIVDDSRRNEGIYKVNNGSATFTAYSNEKLSNGTPVYVTIPEGDFNNDKLIVGKVASLAEGNVYHYVSPLDNFLEVKSLYSQPGEWSLLANHPQNTQICIGENMFAIPLQGLTRIGLGASFKAWLDSQECRFGHYGLRLELQLAAADNSSVAQSSETTEEAVVNNTINLLLDSSQMIGNPYVFENYFKQEAVFDIENVGAIEGYKLFFYQASGSFKNSQGNPIVYTDSLNDELPDNLFVTDIQLSIGQDLRDVKGEYVHLDCFDGLTYSDATEQKNIYLTWVHEDVQTDQKYPIDETSEASLAISDIRWYYFDVNENSDGYGGINWKYINDAAQLFHWTNNNLDEYKQIKVVIIYGEEPGYEPYSELTEQEFNNLKTIIYIYDEDKKEYIEVANNATYDVSTTYYYQTPDIRQVYRSNILTFEKIEDVKVDYGIVDDIVWGLNLNCYDKKDNLLIPSYGNYLLYNEQNELIDQAEGNVIRQIDYQLLLDDGNGNLIDRTAEVKEQSVATWLFPYENTMIKCQEDNDISVREVYQATLLTKTMWEKNYNNGTQNIYFTKSSWAQLVVQEDSTNNIIEADKKYYTLENNGVLVKYKIADDQTELPAGTYYILNSLNKDPAVAVYFTEDPDVVYYTQTNIRSIQTNEPFKFLINRKWSADKDDNWVKCSVEYDGVTYTGVQELTFGQAGTQGANYSVLIDYDNLDNPDIAAIQANKQANYELTVHIYDKNNRELISEEELTGIGYEWGWYNGIVPANISIDAQKISAKTTQLNVTDQLSLTDQSLGILQVKITGLNNAGSETSYPLYAYMPIAIRNEAYGHISGTDKIVYLTDGTPQYYKDEYILYDAYGARTEASWDITYPKSVRYYTETLFPLTSFESGYDYYTKNNNNYSKVTINANSKPDSTIQYYIGLQTSSDGIEYPTINDNNCLVPCSFYIRNPNAPICAAAATVNDNVVYLQPILIIESRYFSAAINEWDGKTVSLNGGEGTILASRIGAGRKNSNNQFSGVILGDWSEKADANVNTLNRYTGLYGFKDGKMSFGFKDDGTAFIGANDAGQILFDGNKSVIQSKDYDVTNGKNGAYFDLYNGQLKLANADGKYLNLNASAPSYPLEIASSNTYTRIGWDGTLYTSNGWFNGTIYGSDIYAGTLNSPDGSITLKGSIELEYSGDNSSQGYLGAMKSGLPLATGASNDNNKGIGFAYQQNSITSYTEVVGPLAEFDKEKTYYYIVNSWNNTSYYIKATEPSPIQGRQYYIGITTDPVNTEVKATSKNCGMKYNNTYLSISYDGIGIGDSTAFKNFLVHTGIVLGSNSRGSNYNTITNPREGQLYFKIVG